MSKRLIAVILIVIGILAIAGVLYWTFRPTGNQPTLLPTTPENGQLVPGEPVPPLVSPSATPPSPVAPSAPPISSAEEQEQQLLLNRAAAFVGRQGSYTNLDGFIALRDIYLDVSPTVRAFYQAEQERLTKEHAVTNGTWVQTVRALSSKITSETPIIGKNQAVVSVQAQQVIEAGLTPAALSYVEFTVTFTREQGVWKVSRIESKPLEL